MAPTASLVQHTILRVAPHMAGHTFNYDSGAACSHSSSPAAPLAGCNTPTAHTLHEAKIPAVVMGRLLMRNVLAHQYVALFRDRADFTVGIGKMIHDALGCDCYACPKPHDSIQRSYAVASHGCTLEMGEPTTRRYGAAEHTLESRRKCFCIPVSENL